MNSTLFTTQIEKIVYNENDMGESFSSISLNPTFAWAKFILTDDQPNENKQRIAKKEFANLIKTGIHAPIKMYLGEIKEDHEDALPLGVITHLKEVENKIEGLAALWTREREKDIQDLKEMYANGNLPQLSWEILYSDSITDESGIEDLQDTALRAVTIVGMPAYAGRTPIFAMASKNKDSNMEEENVEELEQLKLRVKELEDALSAKNDEFTAKASELNTLNTELNELREFKQTVEKENEAALKLEQIKTKFVEANLEKSDEYFIEKRDTLLSLSDEALDFMIQEMVSFSSKQSVASDKKDKKVTIPNVPAENDGLETDPVTLAKELRERLNRNK